MSILLSRVLKQALRSSGANVTDKHITDVSMCALFLLKAAKTCDKVFAVPPQSTAHTVREFKSDIRKIHTLLIEKKIIQEDISRTTPTFVDPTESGLNTLTKGDRLKKVLIKSDENLQNEQGHGEVDIDYELAESL